MSEAMGSTKLKGLPDGVGSVGFASVNRDVEIGALDGLKSREVLLGREAIFTPGEIKADHAAIAPSDGEFGSIQ